MRGLRIYILYLSIATMLYLAACAPQARDESAAAESFYLSVSRGGGITGLVTGCDFNAAGRVRKWRASALGATDSLGSHMLSVASIRERLAELTALPSPRQPDLQSGAHPARRDKSVDLVHELALDGVVPRHPQAVRRCCPRRGQYDGEIVLCCTSGYGVCA